MSIRLEKILEVWLEQKNQHQWILATVVETAGSSYRKSGAMMLINDIGQYFGLISGGCLESDIMRKARQCWDTGRNKLVCYDMREEDDIGWHLGIGCGGMVKILLQPISADNQFLHLEQLLDALKNRATVAYSQDLSAEFPDNQIDLMPNAPNVKVKNGSRDSDIKTHRFEPTPQIGIFGGGVDAEPVANMAKLLGWNVIVYDPRVSYAKRDRFDMADNIIRDEFQSLTTHPSLEQLDAVVIMTHNVKLDGQALSVAQYSTAKFVGLLGPSHRTEKVLKSIGLTYSQLTKPLSNPIGLDIGGELPESIALSITSEIHAVLANKITLSPTQQLTRVG